MCERYYYGPYLAVLYGPQCEECAVLHQSHTCVSASLVWRWRLMCLLSALVQLGLVLLFAFTRYHISLCSFASSGYLHDFAAWEKRLAANRWVFWGRWLGPVRSHPWRISVRYGGPCYIQPLPIFRRFNGPSNGRRAWCMGNSWAHLFYLDKEQVRSTKLHFLLYWFLCYYNILLCIL